MVETTVVRTIRVKGTSEGVEKLTGDLNKLAGAQDNVAVVSEQSARRSMSVEQAYKRLTMQVDENARAQSRIAQANKIADRALEQGLINQQQHAQTLSLISQRYTAAGRATQQFATQTGLARHELINLGRQAQDVGVSLLSGQSPFLVLAQQGSQIADVFATSGGTVRGFFTQAIGFAGRFLGSAAGVATGIGAIGGAALYMASSFASAQKEIDLALVGVGKRAGVTRGEINAMAEANASGARLSISEWQSAASEFVKTGNIYGENLKGLTDLVKGFAVTTGESAEDAAKQLAKIFSGDAASAADQLNKIYGSISGATRQYAVDLDAAGKRQQAFNTLITAVTPAIQDAANVTGFWAAAWDGVANSVSNAISRVGKGLAAITGIGDTREAKRDRIRGALNIAEAGLAQQEADAKLFGANLVPGLEQARAATARLREELERLNKELAKGANENLFLKVGQDADAAVRQLLPYIDKLKEIEALQNKLTKGRGLDTANPGPDDGPIQRGLSKHDQEATNRLAVQRDLTISIAANQARANESGLRLKEIYGASSVEVAKILDSLTRQLDVASAIGQMAQIEAQHKSRVAELSQSLEASEANRIADLERAVALAQIESQHIQTMVALRGQLDVASQVTGIGQINAQYAATVASLTLQVGLTRAIQQAELQRATSIAQVNSQAEETLQRLREEGELIRAFSDYERDRVKARQTYQKLLDQGVDSERASAVARQQLANADEQRLRHEEDVAERAAEAADATARQARAQRQAASAAEDTSAWLETAAEVARRISRELFGFVPFGQAMGRIDPYVMGKTLFQANSGGYTQFNPAGYVSSAGGVLETTAIVRSIYGEGGFDPQTGAPNAQGQEFQFNKMMQGAGGNLQGAINSVLGGGVMTAGALGAPPTVDQTKLGILSRAIDLLPDEQQASSIQALVGQLESAPKSLQTSELIKQLNDKLEQLSKAVDENTSAQEKMTDVLSPFYSSDPRRTYLGFRAFAGGGIMTDQGATPLQSGIAHSRQVAVFGEGSTPEAFVPVPTGRIPVELRTPANSNQKQRPITVNINIRGNADAGTVSALRSTAFQQAQAMRRVMS